MSWHWVGPGRGPLPGAGAAPIIVAIDRREAPSRSAALSAAVGAPVPPRALTMLSSIGVDELVGQHVLLAVDLDGEAARARASAAACFAAATSSGVSPCAGGASEVLEDARRAHDRRLLPGCASGTLMTSIRNSAEFGSLSGASRTQPGSSLGERTPRRARDVDVDVLLVLRIHEHRVRVRAAAGLHVRDVLRVRDVGDVEDPDAAEPVRAHRVLHALAAAVEPAARPSPETNSRFL